VIDSRKIAVDSEAYWPENANCRGNTSRCRGRPRSSGGDGVAVFKELGEDSPEVRLQFGPRWHAIELEKIVTEKINDL
jgi:hypothetical protein